MKLKEIPANTVVHTPTQGEAKELLAILHENGYKWCTGEDLTVTSYIHKKEGIGINIDNVRQNAIIVLERIKTARIYHYAILTLAEFKQKYADPEATVDAIIADNADVLKRVGSDNEKPTVQENLTVEKELDLCELLRGHEGETFYSPIWGECDLRQLNIENNNSSQMLINLRLRNNGTRNITASGHLDYGTKPLGSPILWPSKALYEQYPLDPLKAWSEWQEEQKKYGLQISFVGDDGWNGVETHLSFNSERDYQKAVTAIKAIIEKYSKK